jgi:hypothetical protein
MEYTIEFGGDPYCVTFTTSGAADVSTLLRLTDELVTDPRFRPGMPVLADNSALDTSPLTSADAKAIGQSYRRFLERAGESPIAVVVPGPAAFGLVRMVEAYAGPPPPPLQRIFYSRDEALAWLRDPILH